MDPPLGWLTGSCSSGLDWDQVVDAQAGTLGLTPPVEVELCWGPSSQLGHDVPIGPVVVGVRVVYHLMVSSPDRKRVTPVGNVDSPFSSSSVLNVTCFLGFSSARVGILLHHALLLDSWGLASDFKSCIWRHSHSPGGLDLWRLGDDDEDCLQHSSDVLWCHLDLLLPLNQECHHCDPDCPARESSLGHLAAFPAPGSAEGE